MLYTVKVTGQDPRPLRIRTGPSISYKQVGLKYIGETFDVDDISQSGGWTWYKIVGTSNWCCAQEVGIKYPYLQIIADKTPKPKPPEPTPPPPAPTPPPIDYDGLNDLLNNGKRLPPYDTKFNSELATNVETEDIGGEELQPMNEENARSRSTSYSLYADTSFVKSNIDIVKKNMNMNYHTNFNELNDDLFTKFNRFKINFPDYNLSKSFAYVFFTRPDLNITNEKGTALNSQVSNDPYFSDIWNTNRNIVAGLTKKHSLLHSFHPFLSNVCASFEVTDEIIKTEDVGENFVGYKVIYGKNNHESLTAGTFNMTFVDDKELTIFKTNKLWTEYISKCFKGILVPKKEYKRDRILDYACSVYYFLCAEDGETIIYGHKYTGVFPTNAPASITSWSKGSHLNTPEVTIQFAYSFRESMNLLTLAEFNLQSASLPKKAANIYNAQLGMTGNTFAGAPFVEVIQDASGKIKYKLRHRPY